MVGDIGVTLVELALFVFLTGVLLMLGEFVVLDDGLGV